jgi:hypothetical protein
MGVFDKSIKAAAIANGALKLFQKAYDKLNKSDELLKAHNEEVLEEIMDLEEVYEMNSAQLSANARVKAQLAQFLPVVLPETPAPLDSFEDFEEVEKEDENI